MFLNIIKWFISVLFWLQAFAAPVILFGLIAFFLYSKGERYSNIAFVMLGVGVIVGIIVAEYIRRKIGLETFFARIYGPNEMRQRHQEKKNDQ